MRRSVCAIGDPGDWVRHGRHCGGIWEHQPTGCTVHHCGHPTALWPYYGVLPNGWAPQIWFPAGHRRRDAPAYQATPKWGELAECQEWILRVHRGESPELLDSAELRKECIG